MASMAPHFLFAGSSAMRDSAKSMTTVGTRWLPVAA
jgi:hypothetical protein